MKRLKEEEEKEIKKNLVVFKRKRFQMCNFNVRFSSEIHRLSSMLSHRDWSIYYFFPFHSKMHSC